MELSIKEKLQLFFASNRPSREVLCRSEIFSDRRLQLLHHVLSFAAQLRHWANERQSHSQLQVLQ
jgi:hypothetical protein